MLKREFLIEVETDPLQSAKSESVLKPCNLRPIVNDVT